MENYTIERHLGQGTSDIFLVKCKKTGNFYAQKLIRLEPDNKDHYKQEVDILKQLDHPYCQKLHESIEGNTHSSLITKYCNQGTIDTFYSNFANKYNFQQLLKNFRQLVEAISYLHKLRIIHRDLKDKNILIHDGDVVVSKFGCSKQLNHEKDLTGTYAGTPYNMPPEVLQQQEYGIDIDIYSLGVVMYDLIYPVKIFDCQTIEELMDKQKKIFYPKVDCLVDSLGEILQRMLHPDRAHRPNLETIQTQLLRVEESLQAMLQNKMAPQISQVSSRSVVKMRFNNKFVYAKEFPQLEEYMKSYYENTQRIPHNARIQFTKTIIMHNNMFYFVSNDMGSTFAELVENSRTNQRNLFLNKGENKQQREISSTEMKFNIAIQLCEQIQHFHQIGLVHNNLDLTNVYFKDNELWLGGTGFQLIRQQTNEENFKNFDQYLTQSTDIFAIGVFLCKLFHDIYPFDRREDNDDLVCKYRNGSTVLPKSEPSSIEELNKVILLMLSPIQNFSLKLPNLIEKFKILQDIYTIQ